MATPTGVRPGISLRNVVVAHFPSVFLAVDHEARSRVDLHFCSASAFCCCRIQSRRSVSPSALVEGGAAHAGERGHLPQFLRRVAAVVEGPAVLGGEQGDDERLVAIGRQRARDHGGGQRDLVEREVVEHPAHLAGVDQVLLDVGEGAWAKAAQWVQVREKYSSDRVPWRRGLPMARGVSQLLGLIGRSRLGAGEGRAAAATGENERAGG